MVLPYLFVMTEENHRKGFRITCGQSDNSAAFSCKAIYNGVKHVCQLEHGTDMYLGFLRPNVVQFKDIFTGRTTGSLLHTYSQQVGLHSTY